jgi:hypothetical protein
MKLTCNLLTTASHYYKQIKLSKFCPIESQLADSLYFHLLCDELVPFDHTKVVSDINEISVEKFYNMG